MAEILFKELSFAVIGAAMEVHNILGPGFLESVYQAALAHELSLREIPFEQHTRLPVTYKGVTVGDFVPDFVIEEKIIIEIKAAESIHPKNLAQAHNYLTATGFDLAIVLNFGQPSLERERVVRNEYKTAAPPAKLRSS